MTRPHPSRKDGSRLMSDIIDSLTRKPGQTADELAAELGFGDSAVRLRLNQMLEDGIVAAKKVQGKTKFARLQVWALAEAQPADIDSDACPDFVERRVSTAHYPLVDRRDPLVAALFGQAGSKP